MRANIATNISLNPVFAGLTGFSHEDIRTMLAYYHANAGFEFDENAIFETMRTWYDNYRFSPDDIQPGGAPWIPCVRDDSNPNRFIPPQVANPTLVLYFMQYFLQTRQPPRELVDENLRTDYMKIRHIITEGHRVNGNYHRLEEIITKLGTSAVLRKSFQAKELGSSDNFVSFLFYNGLVTVTGSDMGEALLGIPNQTVGEFLHDFIGRAYDDVYGIDSRVFDIARGMAEFARSGDWHKAIERDGLLCIFFRGRREDMTSIWCCRNFDTRTGKLTDGATICTLDGREFNGATARDAYNRTSGDHQMGTALANECTVKRFSGRLIVRIVDFQNDWDRCDPIWRFCWQDRKRRWYEAHLSYYNGTYFITNFGACWHQDSWTWEVKPGEFCKEYGAFESIYLSEIGSRYATIRDFVHWKRLPMLRPREHKYNPIVTERL